MCSICGLKQLYTPGEYTRLLFDCHLDIVKTERRSTSNAMLIYLSRMSFGDTDAPDKLLAQMRDAALQSEHGSEGIVQLWKEVGPNSAPKWEAMQLDWTVPTCGELGLAADDLLVVQEHTKHLPSYLRTAPEWLQ